MKILFLGGTGRLSKDVVAQAVESGHDVSIITRGSKHREQFCHKNCNSLLGDVKKPETCKEYFSANQKYDVIIDFLSINVQDIKTTLNMIEGAFVQYIFISSATIFKRDGIDDSIDEESPKGNSLWQYAYNKYLCEEWLKDYFTEKKGCYYTIVRPYVTYGNTRVPYPLVPRNTLMEWSLVERMRNGQSIPIFDAGQTITALLNTKDFAYLLVGLFGNVDAYNNDFIIADEEEASWGEVLDTLAKVLNITVKKVDLPKEKIFAYAPEYEPVLNGDKGIDVKFDITKIKSIVSGYKKTVSLENGLHEMVAFYDANPQLKKIDYCWNGKIDKIVEKNGIRDSYKYHFASLKDYFNYLSGRNKFCGDALSILLKIKHIAIKCLR